MTRVNWSYVYVVFRVDPSVLGASLDDGLDTHITIKEVLPSEEAAVAEVERLRRLRPEKGALYFFQNARYYPAGRKVE